MQRQRKRTITSWAGGLPFVLSAILLALAAEAQAADHPLNLSGNASYTNAQLAGYTSINLNGYALTVTDNFTTSVSITPGTNGILTVNGNMTTSARVDCSGGNFYS